MLALGAVTLLFGPIMLGGAALALVARLRGPIGAMLWLVPLASAAVALLALLSGETRGALVLPLGLPGFPLTLVWDGVSALFLLALTLPLAVILRLSSPARPAASGVLVAGLHAIILAGDAYALLVGLALTLASLARLAAISRPRLAAIALVWLLLLAAQAPPLPDGTPNPVFAAWRAPALSPLAGLGLSALVLAGAGLVAAPLFRPARLAACANNEGALLIASLAPSALYLVARFLVDLLAPSAAGATAALALPLGAALALGAAARAAWAEDFLIACAALPGWLVGESVFALGISAWARHLDLAAPTRDATAAFFFLALLAAFAGPLWLALAAVITREAGSRHLARLGGLAWRMPKAALLAGIALTTVLPLGPGFFGAPLALTALLRAPGVGLGAVVLPMLVAVLGILLALAPFVAVRLFGLGFLGPPRTPRASAAEPPRAPEANLLTVLAAALALLGGVPGLGVALIAPALPGLRGGDPETAILLVAAPLATLIAIGLGVGLFLVASRHGARPVATVWEEGYGPRPAWLPFGDPATMIAPEILGAELPASLAPAKAWLRHWLRRLDAAWRAAYEAFLAPPCG